MAGSDRKASATRFSAEGRHSSASASDCRLLTTDAEPPTFKNETPEPMSSDVSETNASQAMETRTTRPQAGRSPRVRQHESPETGGARRPASSGSQSEEEPASAALHPVAVVAQSPSMRRALDLARRIADSPSTVLITGETGTGKEVIANLIHRSSDRADGPLVKLNCSALPEGLLESELFGHEQGAFTGADVRRTGRFESASRGTLFLDEIGDMSPATQSKLLRVLQDQEFHRVGGVTPIRTDARIVAATHRDLATIVRRGHFREDLYFRLGVIDIHLPPLRERPEDAVALAQYFLRHFEAELGCETAELSEAALDQIRAHSWPGNARELRNVLERQVLMREPGQKTITSLHLPEGPERGESGLALELPSEGVSLAAVERDLVRAALRRTGFVQKRAAALLGISSRKLNYMIRQMGLTHPSWRANRGPNGAEGG